MCLGSDERGNHVSSLDFLFISTDKDCELPTGLVNLSKLYEKICEGRCECFSESRRQGSKNSKYGLKDVVFQEDKGGETIVS